MERELVHGPGDYLGETFRLRDWQRGLIYKLYELRPDGSRRYRRALIGLPKGNGKTEIAAAIGVTELAGPVVFNGWGRGRTPKAKQRLSPDIPVGAASYDQADRVFGAAKAMIQNGPLAELFDCYEREIQPKEGSGSMYRVAAEAGTNDGGRPTFFIADELHEWLGRKARVHLVISNGLAKRADSWGLSITTAGCERHSLLGKLYDYGCQVRDGLIEDGSFLFVWYEASPGYDLKTQDGVRAAAIEANPAAGDFLSLDDIVRRKYELGQDGEHEWLRYHGNNWVPAPDDFMLPETWEAAEDKGRTVPEGAQVTLGFDGSYNRDSTALVGCTVENPHLFTVGAWERPMNDENWKVDKDDVEQTILEALARWEVACIAVDDTFGRMWSFVFDSLRAKGVEVVEWPTRSPGRMSRACVPFKSAIRDGDLTHDGDPRLARHMLNGKLKEDRFGPRIVKDAEHPEKHIDLAVAGIIAHDMAMRPAEQTVEWTLV